MEDDKFTQLINWLNGERYGYLLDDGQTWICYGELNDKFPYDESKKQYELSRNHMINKTIRKIKEIRGE